MARRRTNKLPTAAAVALAFAAIWSDPAWTATMALSTGLLGDAGATVTSRLTIAAVGGLQMEALDVDIGYDPARLAVLAVRCGPPLPQSAVPANMIACSIDPPLFNPAGGSGNELRIRGLVWTVPVTPNNGDVLLEIDFRIQAGATPGPTSQTLRLAQVNEPPDPSFTSEGPTPNATAGQITISAPAADVPIPAAAIGLLMLLLGVVGWRRAV